MIETKKIGDICTSVFAGGTPSTKHEEYYDGDIPWIRSGEIDFNIIRKAERNITEEGYKNSSAKMIPANSVVMAMTGATVAKTAIVGIATTANQSVCAMVPNSDILDYRYLYYHFCKDYYIVKASAQGALTSLNLAMIKNLEIPLPPLSIQKEIVSVLDKFSELIEKTDEEIALRQKQYEYYREKLLTFEDGEVEWKKLGKICKIQTGPFGSQLHQSDYSFYGVPVIMPKDIINNAINLSEVAFINEDKAASLEKHRLNRMDIVFPRRGDIAKCAIVTSELEGALCGTGCMKVSFPEYILPKFALYRLTTNESVDWIIKNAVGASMLNLNTNILGNMFFPVLSLSRQQKIVDTLDKFEALISKLKEERELRQKQYEYYREKLLTF